MGWTWTKADRDTEPLTYDEAFAICATLAGSRVRMTYPNGAQRVGVVDVYQAPRHPAWREDAPDAEPVIRFDGRMVLGELAGCVRVEVLGVNRRYIPAVSA